MICIASYAIYKYNNKYKNKYKNNINDRYNRVRVLGLFSCPDSHFFVRFLRKLWKSCGFVLKTPPAVKQVV